MRSIWKGAISFGLVTIPVKLYSATEEKDVSFHQVHRSDGGRVKYKRVCSIDGQEVSYGEIAKGYEISSGEVVVLTDADFADLPLATSRTIDVLEFVPLEQVDPIHFAKSYYLEPEAAGTRPYVLLRDALEESGQVALVKIALRQRESLATLRVRDGVFVLEMMLWPDEIRTPDFGFLKEKVEVRPQELQMARSLIETLTGDFAPEQYTDNYRDALQAVIEAKIDGREVVAPAEPAAESAQVVDLMSALRASVEAAKKGRVGGVEADATVLEPPPEASAEKPAEASKPARSSPSRTRSKPTAAEKVAAEPAAEEQAPAKKPAARTSRRKSA